MKVPREHPLYSCFSKIERARKHAVEFRQCVRDWFEIVDVRMGAYPVGNGLVEIRAKSKEPLPDDLHHSAAEAIYQARSTLDQMLQAIAQQHGVKALDEIAFPFMKSDDEFSSKTTSKKLYGLPKETKKLVFELKPWRDGGNSDLWGLGKLANVDKHRLFIAFGGVGGLAVLRNVEVDGGGHPDSVGVVATEGNLLEGVTIARLGENGFYRPQPGFELIIDAEITFDETVEVFARADAAPVIDRLINMVDDIVTQFIPHIRAE